MILRIEFHGLCLIATGKGKLEPREDDIVTVLLAENAQRRVHRDGTAAIEHHPHLLIPGANVRDPLDFEVVTANGSRSEYVVVPLRGMDLTFEPEPMRPDHVPSGEDTTVGLSRIIDLDWFTDGLELSPVVRPMHDHAAVEPRSLATRIVATRVRLRRGYFHTRNADPDSYEWSYETTLAHTHKYPPRHGLAEQLFFTASVPGLFHLVLKPFDGGAPIRIEITGDENDEIHLQLGNECLDPKDWDVPEARCDPSSKPPGNVVRDTDFKAHYELLESANGRPLELRLGTRELPVPTITRVKKPTAGSEWCERALIQVD